MNINRKSQRNVIHLCLSVLLCGIIVLSLFACKGSDGPTGPAGPMGNADVRMFKFGPATTTSGWFVYTLDTLSQGYVDSCMILSYCNPSNEDSTAWYPIPGMCAEGAYMTRSFLYRNQIEPHNYLFNVRLLTPNGTSTYTASVTFNKLKVIFAPASTMISLTKSGQVNTADYYSVMNALRLQR